jgi:hypothetical protein
MRNPRSAIYQRPKISLGASDGKIFQYIAASIHDGDHNAGERLAERERAGHRKEGDRINPQPAGQEIPSHRKQQPSSNWNCAGGPAPLRDVAAINEPGDKAEKKAGHSDDCQPSPEQPFIDDYRHWEDLVWQQLRYFDLPQSRSLNSSYACRHASGGGLLETAGWTLENKPATNRHGSVRENWHSGLGAGRPGMNFSSAYFEHGKIRRLRLPPIALANQGIACSNQNGVNGVQDR